MNSQCTVMLIDDDAKLLSALERRLVNEGYEVQTAISAGEAYAMLKRTAVDVIVCDNRMPGVSGLEFLGQIKREYPSTKRIILSGNVGAAQAFQAMTTHGISSVLTKPCDFDTLCSAIAEAVETPRSLHNSHSAPGNESRVKL